MRPLRTRIADRVYVIGLQNVPPFQQKAEDGSPAGLAVDLVREAARRRGLLLRASHWMLVLAPPLTITSAEVDDMLNILEASLQDVLGTGVREGTLVGGRASA